MNERRTCGSAIVPALNSNWPAQRAQCWEFVQAQGEMRAIRERRGRASERLAARAAKGAAGSRAPGALSMRLGCFR